MARRTPSLHLIPMAVPLLSTALAAYSTFTWQTGYILSEIRRQSLNLGLELTKTKATTSRANIFPVRVMAVNIVRVLHWFRHRNGERGIFR